jgi:hypothetical protein
MIGLALCGQKDQGALPPGPPPGRAALDLRFLEGKAEGGSHVSFRATYMPPSTLPSRTGGLGSLTPAGGPGGQSPPGLTPHSTQAGP